MSDIDTRVLHMAVGVLKPLAMLPDRDAQVAYVHAHPVVLSERCLQLGLLRPELKPIFEAVLPVFGFRVAKLQGGTGYSSNPDRYPLGHGPLEAIWREMEDGEVSEARAIELVAERGIAGNLMFVYAKAAMDNAYTLALAGDRLRAAKRQRIVVEAAEQLSAETSLIGDPERWLTRFTAARIWVELAAVALVELPDGRMFHHARALGEAIVAEAAKRGATNERAHMLERLGILYLDPYTVNRRTKDYALEIKRWRGRLADELGDAAARTIDAKWPLPAPEEALAKADALLTESVATRVPGERWVAGTALAQCLMFRRELGQGVTDDRVRAVISDTLAELAKTDEHEKIAKLQLYLQHLDQ
jgi:hypothetical protein